MKCTVNPPWSSGSRGALRLLLRGSHAGCRMSGQSSGCSGTGMQLCLPHWTTVLAVPFRLVPRDRHADEPQSVE
eukprot:scaffold5586_cov124-Isochrysis_galbana.AAC.3